MPRKYYRILLRRRLIIICLLIMQLKLIIYLIASSSRHSIWIEYALTAVSISVVLHVVGENKDSAYTLIWVTLILLFPLFGGLFYLIFNCQRSMRQFQKEMEQIEKKSKPLFQIINDHYENVSVEAPDCVPQIQYLRNFAGFPICGHTKTEYLSPGEVKFQRLIEALKKAEKYIFLEYFIICEGIMWNTILDILKDKASMGIDVRIIYDDIGCFFHLPKDYPKRLEEFGIKCVIFNPFRPLLTSKQNNRDHRKIAVVDGKVAFTGGINLSDEYINAVNKRGHWKDAAIMLSGEAAWSFTLMFLKMWSVCTKTEEDFTEFYPWQGKCSIPDDGFVQPYADSPLDKERVGEHVYLQIINNAKRYIYINTPYLILNENVISALTLSAKSSVDVRIVTPHIGDNWYVHTTTRAYYRELILAGVKIYEYSNGYIHSKTFVSDDKVATVGTANLDYRSLYLNFECGVWLFKSNAVKEIYDDFIKTLDRCHQITEQDCKSNTAAHFVQNILLLLAPLM